jgi:hypothetical protein
MAFDIKDLTMAEIEEFENTSGVPIDMLSDDAVPKGKPYRVLAWIVKRRSQPEFRFEDTAKLSLNQVHDILFGDDPKGE